MKQIVYQGDVYEAPDWANYVCADGDGQVYAYEYEPTWVSDERKYHQNDGRARCLDRIKDRPPIQRI